VSSPVHYRVAADNAKARVGLPEIQGRAVSWRRRHPARGAHDAAGDALQFLLKGDQIRLAQAKGMKLIDAVVPADGLVQAAKD